MRLHLRLTLLLGLLVSFLLGLSAPASCDDLRRSARIRAAVVYYAAKFIRWPKEEPNKRDPLELCLLGDGSFEESVAETVSGKSVRGRMLTVRQIQPTKQPDWSQSFVSCDLVVVEDPPDEVLKILAKIPASHPVLSVCRVDSVVWNRCIVQIFDKSNKASIAIDLPMAEKLGFQVSAELLSLAEVRDSTEE